MSWIDSGGVGGRDTDAIDRLCDDITDRVRAYLNALDSDSSRIQEGGGWKWAEHHILLSEDNGTRRHAMLNIDLSVEGTIWTDSPSPGI